MQQFGLGVTRVAVPQAHAGTATRQSRLHQQRVKALVLLHVRYVEEVVEAHRQADCWRRVREPCVPLATQRRSWYAPSAGILASQRHDMQMKT